MKLALTPSGIVDFLTGARGLEQENTLMSAVIISLLSDRRAAPDDRLPETPPHPTIIPQDRKGWAGDMLADIPGDKVGSRLWLLAREKQTEETRRRAIFYVEEALQWVIDDGHASSIEIDAIWSDIGRLDMTIDINLIEGGLFNLTLNDVTGAINAV